MDDVPQTPSGPRPTLLRRVLVGRRITEPGCGRCGYPVRGLHSTICPECGADQRVVGVVHPYRLPRWIGATGWLVAWAALLIGLAWVGNDALLSLTPRGLSNHRDYVLRPASRPYEPFEVRRIGYGWGWLTDSWIPREPDRGWIKLDPVRPGGQYLAQADFNVPHRVLSTAVRWRPPPHISTFEKQTSRTSTLDAEEILKWMSQLEIDVSAPDVRAEADELLAFITAPDFNPAHHEGLRHFAVLSETGGPEINAKRDGQPILTTAWVLVGLIGAAVILRARRRRKPVAGVGSEEGTRGA